MIHGFQPGPLFISDNAQLFWGLITSMYIGNAMLVILNLPLIGLWVKLLKVPYHLLFPLILLFCLIGVYTLNNNTSEMLIMLIFGVIGYLMRKFEYDAAPFLIAVVLGPMAENNLRQALLISKGSLMVFITRPISAGFLLGATIMVLTLVRQRLKVIGEEASP
jgi:putative tricarboxylic transport membrane protein